MASFAPASGEPVPSPLPLRVGLRHCAPVPVHIDAGLNAAQEFDQQRAYVRRTVLLALTYQYQQQMRTEINEFLIGKDATQYAAELGRQRDVVPAVVPVCILRLPACRSTRCRSRFLIWGTSGLAIFPRGLFQ
ncbi:hypothetical protein [Duganella hordei]|uniref:hypothetical protein n=1 Tax=Duganella hordei TaxID=2865934 RepID=UPI00333F4833